MHARLFGIPRKGMYPYTSILQAFVLHPVSILE